MITNDDFVLSEGFRLRLMLAIFQNNFLLVAYSEIYIGL